MYGSKVISCCQLFKVKGRGPNLCTLQKGVSDSVALVWDLRICIASKFPGGTAVVSPGLHFENHCSTQNPVLGKLDPEWERVLSTVTQ